MNASPRSLLFLVGCLLALAPSAEAADPPAGWRLHDPLVLEQAELNGDEAGSSLEAVDAVWLAGKPVVSLWRQNTRELVLWREDRPGVWIRWGTLNGLSRNSHLAVLADSLYVAGRISGRSDRVDVGTIHVWRLNLQGQVVSSQQCAERSERGQWSVAHLGVYGTGLMLWLSQPAQTQPAQTQRELVATLSHDGGRTWRPLFDGPLPAEALLAEVEERLPVIAGADKQLVGAFVSKASAPPEAAAANAFADPRVEPSSHFWFHSQDGGTTWRQSPVRLNDEYQANDRRMVLAAATVDGDLLTAYLAGDTLNQTGRLMVGRSADRGRNWARSQPISEKRPWQPLRARLLPAGQLVALSWREADEQGAAGRLTVSHDRGQSWHNLPLAEFYRGPVSSTWALAASPTGDRLVCGAVVHMPAEGAGRTYFTLQEYSARAPAALALNLQPAIARKIAALGDEDYNTRQQASRELEALGREAKEPLSAAYRTSTDAEVRQRLKVILAKMFPPCLQIR